MDRGQGQGSSAFQARRSSFEHHSATMPGAKGLSRWWRNAQRCERGDYRRRTRLWRGRAESAEAASFEYFTVGDAIARLLTMARTHLGALLSMWNQDGRASDY
ncbi:MAG: hypothetical protein U1D30_02495 [Planctomycetota bacterium]